MEIVVAARAASVRLLEFQFLVALLAGNILMKREEVLRRVLELDVREGKAGGVAILALHLEAVSVRRAVAARTARLRLLISVAGVALDLAVAAEERKSCVRMLVEKARVGGVGRLLHTHLARDGQLERLGAARLEEDGQREEGRPENDEEGRPPIDSSEYPHQSPQSPLAHLAPWHSAQFRNCWQQPLACFVPPRRMSCAGRDGTPGPFWPARIGLSAAQQPDAVKAKRMDASPAHNVFPFIIICDARAMPH